MNSHTVACGGVSGIAAAGILIVAPAVGADGDPVDPVDAIDAVDAVGDEHPISANNVAPATAVTLRFKRIAGAERRISMVRSWRKSSTCSLKTWVFPPAGVTVAWFFQWGRACQLA
jgi:hypothetical protein